MGMYCGFLLTPTAPKVVPQIKNVVQFLKWLVEKGDMNSPTAEEPLVVETGLDPQGIQDAEELTEFQTLDEQLELFLKQQQEWDIPIDYDWYVKLTKTESLPEGTFSHSLKLFNPKDNWFYTLQGMYISLTSLKPYQEWGLEDNFPERNFVIRCCSDLKMRDEGGLEQNYTEVAWDSLKTTGILAEMEQILGIKLEIHSVIC